LDGYISGRRAGMTFLAQGGGQVGQFYLREEDR